jgi:hypothetical protein
MEFQVRHLQPGRVHGSLRSVSHPWSHSLIAKSGHQVAYGLASVDVTDSRYLALHLDSK